MKRPQSHVLDEEAQQIFRQLLPSAWLVRKQNPDYGIDYHVELVEEEEPTGIQFAVQLKGTQKVRVKHGAARFPCETDHLVYYLDKVLLPVFLVLVDVSSRRGYWLFTQAYAIEKLKDRNWRQQKTVTLRLPVESVLSDVERLKRGVKRAVARMAELHPAAISGAIAAQRDRIQSIDPRFTAHIHATEQGTHCQLVATEPVEVTFTFKGRPDELPLKMEELISRGQPVSWRPHEMEVAGSPLFNELGRRGGTVQFSRKLDMSLSLTARDANGNLVGSIEHVPGELYGGVSELHYHGGLAGSPLLIDFPCKVIAEDQPCRVHVILRRQSWSGQPIRQLAYFDQLASVFGRIDQIRRLDVTGSVQGNRMFSGSTTAEKLGPLNSFSLLLGCLKRARELASYFKVNPVMPSDFGREHVFEIEQAYGLFHAGEYRKSGEGVRVSVEVLIYGIRDLVPQLENSQQLHALKLHRGTEPFPFLGVEINLGPFDFVLTEARCETTAEELRHMAKRGGDSAVGLSFVGTANSELILQRSESE